MHLKCEQLALKAKVDSCSVQQSAAWSLCILLQECWNNLKTKGAVCRNWNMRQSESRLKCSVCFLTWRWLSKDKKPPECAKYDILFVKFLQMLNHSPTLLHLQTTATNMWIQKKTISLCFYLLCCCRNRKYNGCTMVDQATWGFNNETTQFLIENHLFDGWHWSIQSKI